MAQDQKTGCGPSGCGVPLTPEQERILHGHGTERPGSSALNAEKRAGIYHCAGCGRSLFDAAMKYESGSGWPSFFETLPEAVGVTRDASHGMVRTEVHCAGCEGHLGHVFPDGPRPTGLRYCMNGLALDFRPS
ncbi:peptide-methionine (R)-S-oxide reductase MsrB [Brytella acorum]|uniref:peptide-methionine (R)-S-oxide reductase n=1 Tax=Brytella acorum TaxID=2959299 RepID=A0AA35UJC8_9PROT|nr:peptide-methionine (R)-S-oxide reductase MsrB [Brytella acorum]MDF3623459.1 peptide-methionine (R)-S-oxide reductase MsrB [Brytella acorum]CAI9121409.1 peptide-methionine (R)-S-oxide reductase MsrB [Brytella acorum]